MVSLVLDTSLAAIAGGVSSFFGSASVLSAVVFLLLSPESLWLVRQVAELASW